MLKELGIRNAIDCHTHSGGTDAYNYFVGNLPHTQAVSDLMFKARLAGVDKVVTFPFPGSTYYNTRTLVLEGRREPSGFQDFPYQTENRVLVSDCEQFKGDIFPFACIDPNTEVHKQIDFLRELLDSGKIYGLKFHTLACGCGAEKLITSGFAEFAQGNNLPILVHSGP
ncbi:MAG: hypothetical protein FD167_4751, partial [bacterium]